MTITLIDGGPGCMRDDCMITVVSQSTTAAYYPPVYNKDGVNVNPDRNKFVQEVRCLSCGKNWKKDNHGTETNT